MNEEMRRSYPCDEKPEGAAARRRYPFEEPKADLGRETHLEPQGPERRGKGKRGGNSAMSVVISGKKKQHAGGYVPHKQAPGREPEGVEDFNQEQLLRVLQNTEIGSFLALPDGQKVLLPFAEQTGKPEIGEILPVFLYKDKGGRLTVTMRKPLLRTGELGALKVAEITRIGAFLDNGVPKQLLVPFKEQICTPQPGSEALVYLYEDKTGRQAATMRVYKHLSSHAPYEKDDRVKGFVYEINPQLGVFVAVDDKYFGLIPKAEVFDRYHYGQRVECRVLRVREDGKLDLSAREKAYEAIGKDAEAVLAELRARGGRLPYADKAEAALIEETFHMSKNQFKRAVGSLYRQRKIEIDRKADTITLLEDQ